MKISSDKISETWCCKAHFNCVNDIVESLYTCDFKQPHNQKSEELRSGELGGHLCWKTDSRNEHLQMWSSRLSRQKKRSGEALQHVFILRNGALFSLASEKCLYSSKALHTSHQFSKVFTIYHRKFPRRKKDQWWKKL